MFMLTSLLILKMSQTLLVLLQLLEIRPTTKNVIAISLFLLQDHGKNIKIHYMSLIKPLAVCDSAKIQYTAVNQ